MEYLLSGFLLGGSLIVAIGAQNAFLLKQGLLRSHVFILCVICGFSDAILMCAGVLGVGALISGNTVALLVMTIGGAAFLSLYGSLSLWRAYRGNNGLMVGEGGEGGEGSEGGQGQKFSVVVGTVLALTYLNPHVYLDTVVIFGSLSATLDWQSRIYFLSGGILSSFTWFFLLGYGAQLLIPLFRRPVTWRVLDIFIAGIMFWIAIGLSRYAIDTWQSLW